MNANAEAIEAIKSATGPALRSYAYADWAGWLASILILFAVAAIAWVKREKLKFSITSYQRVWVGHVVTALCSLAAGLLLLEFIPFTLRTFAAPEAEAVKTILQ